MRRFALGVLGAIAGYVAFAFAGYNLIELLSSNVHDRSVEAAMTSAFVAGPLGALIGLVAGIVLGGRKRTAAS
jgi:hypothetical protein